MGLLVLIQSCAVATTAHLATNQPASEAGQIGMIVGLLFFVGGAFGFGLPLVSAIVFAIAASFGFSVAGDFSDMGVWAAAAAVLAALSVYAWRSGRAKRAKATPGQAG